MRSPQGKHAHITEIHRFQRTIQRPKHQQHGHPPSDVQLRQGPSPRQPGRRLRGVDDAKGMLFASITNAFARNRAIFEI